MEAATAEEPVIFFKKSRKPNASLRKRAATPPPANSDSEYSESASDNEEHKIKRRKRAAGVVTADSSSIAKPPTEDLIGPSKFAATNSRTIEKSDDATKQSNWYENDAAASTSKSDASEAVAGKDNVYKGTSTYQSFIKTNPNAPQSKTKLGPVKAPTNVRQITVTDFAPDVCKDYKKTGFCGFGDSCKFLHAREDYKQGWQLDREWEKDKFSKKGGTTVASAASRNGTSASSGAKRTTEEEEAEAKMLEKIPFACVICEESYKNPIVTNCNHYFCEDCAIKRFRKTPTCAICGAGTGGVFNGAKNLKKLLDRKKEREEARKAAEEAAEAEGEGTEE
jgi:RING finger protein 113A